MKIRIISDGLPGKGTKVVDADTGELIRGIRSVTWHHEAGDDVPTATLEFLRVEIDGVVINPTSVIIPLSEYEELLKDQEELRRLEANGVDNWSGYSMEGEG